MDILILASVGRVLLSIALVAVGVLLIGLVLLQKNRGSGLSGAFGGVGGHSAFGTKTGDMLTWVTVGMTALLMILAIVGNFVFEEKPLDANIPAATETVPDQAADEAAEETADTAETTAPVATPAAPTSDAPAETPTETPAPTPAAAPTGAGE